MIHPADETLKRLAENLAPVKGVAGIKDVCVSKVWPSDRDSLPRLHLYFADEAPLAWTGRQPGHRIAQRTMQFFVVAVFAKPMGPRNTLETDQLRVMAVVEGILAADPHLVRDGRALLSDLRPDRTATGFDGTGQATVAIVAMPIIAVAHHREGRLDETLTQATF